MAQDDLDRDFSEDELTSVISSLKLGKSVGFDKISAEILKAFK